MCGWLQCVWPTSAGWMMKCKVNENCQGKITAASKVLKPVKRQRVTSCSIREKALREDYVHSSLVFTHLYAADCFLCVANWCFRGFGSFCPFGCIYTCVNVFVWQEFSFCASLCVSVCVVSVCRAPRFKGYQQQDSQELLHYLLDSMRVEETKVSVCDF